MACDAYVFPMTAVDQIKDSISSLPASDFYQLLDWMNERQLEVLGEDGYESPELEAAMLKALDGPRYPVDEAFYEGIRKRWRDKKSASVSIV